MTGWLGMRIEPVLLVLLKQLTQSWALEAVLEAVFLKHLFCPVTLPYELCHLDRTMSTDLADLPLVLTGTIEVGAVTVSSTANQSLQNVVQQVLHSMLPVSSYATSVASGGTSGGECGSPAGWLSPERDDRVFCTLLCNVG